MSIEHRPSRSTSDDPRDETPTIALIDSVRGRTGWIQRVLSPWVRHELAEQSAETAHSGPMVSQSRRFAVLVQRRTGSAITRPPDVGADPSAAIQGSGDESRTRALALTGTVRPPLPKLVLARGPAAPAAGTREDDENQLAPETGQAKEGALFSETESSQIATQPEPPEPAVPFGSFAEFSQAVAGKLRDLKSGAKSSPAQPGDPRSVGRGSTVRGPGSPIAPMQASSIQASPAQSLPFHELPARTLAEPETPARETRSPPSQLQAPESPAQGQVGDREPDRGTPVHPYDASRPKRILPPQQVRYSRVEEIPAQDLRPSVPAPRALPIQRAESEPVGHDQAESDSLPALSQVDSPGALNETTSSTAVSGGEDVARPRPARELERQPGGESALPAPVPQARHEGQVEESPPGRDLFSAPSVPARAQEVPIRPEPSSQAEIIVPKEAPSERDAGVRRAAGQGRARPPSQPAQPSQPVPPPKPVQSSQPDAPVLRSAERDIGSPKDVGSPAEPPKPVDATDAPRPYVEVPSVPAPGRQPGRTTQPAPRSEVRETERDGEPAEELSGGLAEPLMPSRSLAPARPVERSRSPTRAVQRSVEEVESPSPQGGALPGRASETVEAEQAFARPAAAMEQSPSPAGPAAPEPPVHAPHGPPHADARRELVPAPPRAPQARPQVVTENEPKSDSDANAPGEAPIYPARLAPPALGRVPETRPVSSDQEQASPAASVLDPPAPRRRAVQSVHPVEAERGLRRPLPPAPLVAPPPIQRRTATAPVEADMAPRAADTPSSPSVGPDLIQRATPPVEETVTFGEPDEGLDLDRLAREVYPYLKRLLSVERDRRSGRWT